MPCVCFGAYAEQDLLIFNCGHVAHQLCTDRHVAYRISNGLEASCPVCNAPGEPRGHVYLNIDETDVEHFGVNNRQIFEEIANRNNIVTHHAEIMRMANAMQLSAENIRRDLQQFELNNREDADTIADTFILPQLGMRATVNANGVLLSNYVPDANDGQQSSDDENEDEDSDDYEADVLNIIDMGLDMRVSAESIVFRRAEPNDMIEV